MKKALIRNSDGRVMNIFKVDPSIKAPDEGKPDFRYKVPPGHRMVNASPDAVIGGHYANGVFSTTQEVDDAKAEREAKRRAKLPSLIKAEANRRILELSEKHDQRNKTARGVELLSKQVDAIIAHLGIPDPLTAKEVAEKNANLALFDEIKRLRKASNNIEKMDPIPEDFDDEGRWRKK